MEKSQTARADTWLEDAVQEAVDEWFVAQGQQPSTCYRLYYSRGKIIIASDEPHGYEAAPIKAISPAWTKGQARYACIAALRSCPCLPAEK